MLLCGQYFPIKIIERIRSTVESEPLISRRDLSRRVCDWLGWKSENGKLKDMSCRIALLKLQQKGILKLPKTSFRVGLARRKKNVSFSLPDIGLVRAKFEELGEIELVLIRSRYSKESRIWRGLMERYHYLGSGPLCGAQLRYLVKSSRYGWLGGLSFSGAAWRVSCRDDWIGWSDAARKSHLHQVVCNSRFLILPQVHVPNLASHLLSRCAKQLPGDWFNRYGYFPALLETFVESKRYSGTSYRAANWRSVGTTKGRGRQDCDHKASVSIKEIFLYPIRKNWRKLLCQEPVPMFPPAEEKAEEMVFTDWAEEEFGSAKLGDNRLRSRLLILARGFYDRPLANIPEACGSRSKTKGAYRFFENKETEMERLLEPHYESTIRRARKNSVVLSVQDTTSLNYTSHRAMKDIGPIASRRKGSVGLLVHDTMVFNIDGTPLGLLDVQCWKRDSKDIGKKAQRRKLPIEKRESNKWLTSFKATCKAQKQCPQTMFVSVGDRESDVYELFDLAFKDKAGPQLLVRAEHNRLLSEGEDKLWEKIMKEPVSGFQELNVPRKGSRPSRVARMSVRFAQVELKPNKSELKPKKIWAVFAQEEQPPAHINPLEWMLLTTLEVTSFEQAVEKLQWYALRWGIEVYHRTLKSGCRIENRQLGNGESIKSCLSIDMVVAWRIYHLTKLGRETPDMPCSVFFQEEEWKALASYVNRNPVPPTQPPGLREAIRMVAGLGGFLGRKSDGEPGTQTMWRGLQRLDDITEMWKVMTNVPHPLNPTVSSKTDYG